MDGSECVCEREKERGEREGGEVRERKEERQKSTKKTQNNFFSPSRSDQNKTPL